MNSGSPARDLHTVVRSGLERKDPAYAVLYKFQRFAGYTESSLLANRVKYSTHAQLNDAFDLAARFPDPFGPTTGEIWDFEKIVAPLAGTGYVVPADPFVVAKYVSEIKRLRPLESLALCAAQLGLRELTEALEQIEPTHRWCGTVLFNAMVIAKFLAERAHVFCLAESPSDQLMWGYYGDGLRGLCVGYGCPVGMYPLIVEPVTYTHRVGKFSPIEAALDPHETSKKLLYTKPLAWKHEREYRAMMRINNDEQVVDSMFPIVELIVGARMPNEQREIIANVAKVRGVKLFEAVPSFKRGMYGISIREI